jgi:hypothetical protein
VALLCTGGGDPRCSAMQWLPGSSAARCPLAPTGAAQPLLVRHPHGCAQPAQWMRGRYHRAAAAITGPVRRLQHAEAAAHTQQKKLATSAAQAKQQHSYTHSGLAALAVDSR